MPTHGPCVQRLTWGWSRGGCPGHRLPRCLLREGGACKARDPIWASQVQPDASSTTGYPGAMGLGGGRIHLASPVRAAQPSSSVDGGGGGPADQLAAPGLREAPGSSFSPQTPCACLASSFPESRCLPPPGLPSSGLLPSLASPPTPVCSAACSLSCGRAMPLPSSCSPGQAQCALGGAGLLGPCLGCPACWGFSTTSSAGVSCSSQGPGQGVSPLLQNLTWGLVCCQGPVKGGTLVSVLSTAAMPSVTCPDL